MSLSKSVSNESKSERHLLTLDEKFSLIQKSESGLSRRKLATEFRISVGCVNKILKRKAEVFEQFEANASSQRLQLKIRKTDNDEMNRLMRIFF